MVTILRIIRMIRMIFRALPERLSDAEIDEMLRAADTDGEQDADYEDEEEEDDKEEDYDDAEIWQHRVSCKIVWQFCVMCMNIYLIFI